MQAKGSRRRLSLPITDHSLKEPRGATRVQFAFTEASSRTIARKLLATDCARLTLDVYQFSTYTPNWIPASSPDQSEYIVVFRSTTSEIDKQLRYTFRIDSFGDAGRIIRTCFLFDLL